MRDALKTIVISFLISFNVCVWRDALGGVFDLVVVVILGLVLGVILYGFLYKRKRK